MFNSIKVEAYYSNQIYVANTGTLFADNSQWKLTEGKWMCGTTYGEMYHNAWVNTNNKWYYINTSGYMTTDCWINDWYVGDDGEWIPNANKNDGQSKVYH
jgi:glucan-binding YG repeat protein